VAQAEPQPPQAVWLERLVLLARLESVAAVAVQVGLLSTKARA
jgi:hypothetical protein